MTHIKLKINLTLALVLVLLLSLSAVAFALDPPGCNPEQTICIGPTTLSQGVGNASGGIADSSACPSFSALTGVGVKINSYLRQARSHCTGLLFDSSSGNVTPEGSGSYGDWMTNTPPYQLTDGQSVCPAGKVVVGYKSRSDLLVDGVQVICDSFTGYRPAGVTSVGGYTGGGGGYANSDVFCPAGQVAVGIEGQAGDGIDYFRLQCARLYVSFYLPLVVR